MKRGLLQRVSDGLKGFRFVGYGAGGSGGGDFWSFWNRSLPGAEYDYRRESGNLWENSVALSLMSWQARQFAQAPFVVEEPGDQPGEYEHVDGHPLSALIRRPNLFWTRRQLWGATLLSLNCSGNAYWIKIRSGAGRPVELWWVPHWMMWPLWPSDGSAFISGYRYRVEGTNYDYPISDVVHHKNDLINPLAQRLGLATFSASLREVCTENEAATMEAALMRNRGLPGVILSPKTERMDEITKEKAEKIKRLYADQFTGDGNGQVFMSNEPLDVNIPQFSPDSMALPTIRGIAAARIAAPTGIDPMVIGLQSDQKTYSNYEEANRGAWEHNILPTQGSVAETLDVQLLPDFESDPRRQCGFDNTRVSALQEKRDDLYKRVTLAVGGPWLSPNEGRGEAGLDDIDGGEKLYPPPSKPAADGGADPGSAQNKKALDRWREAIEAK